ncbi:hypothetical protein [Sphingomonas sp.]|uniref:hypothetical protein n=1 Tax=Sphingomonas sp. TaxID=28214 RepID=UPI001ECE1A97|nr:hypothetical protein [Sphingomonas sp.]MBX3593524.1 hypothetical protein [Sphingomonas sp.]
MNWALTAGSLAAVLALAGVARLLRLGGPRPIASGEDAVAIADAMVTGFTGRAGIVSASGAHAAATSGPGDCVLIEPMGARYRAQRIAGARIAMLSDGDGTVVTIATAPETLVRITVADTAAARRFAEILGD